jgi:copper chaperone CopZ
MNTHNNSSSTYALSGLHCSACVRKVSAALQPFGTDVQVSLAPMQVTLTHATQSDANAAGSRQAMQAALAAVGNYQFIEKTPDVIVIPSHPTAQIIANEVSHIWLSTYYPLLLIAGYILLGSVLLQVGLHAAAMGKPMGLFMHLGMGLATVTAGETMRYFMAGFFLVFSFFKLLDVRAFANAYAGYDLLAARWQGWGLVYPFVELALGMAYLANYNPMLTNWATVIIMGFSAIGVIRAVRSKTQIQCACLGTVFKLPMSTVTIVEDLGMVLMAAVMLAMK